MMGSEREQEQSLGGRKSLADIGKIGLKRER